VFTSDAVVDTSDDGGGTTRSASESLEMLRTSIESVATVHHGHMPEIELTSATTGRAVWATEDRLWWSEGAASSHMHGYGHYHDTHEKTSAGWQITSMTLGRLKREFDRAGQMKSKSTTATNYPVPDPVQRPR